MNEHRGSTLNRVITVRTPENIEITYLLAGPTGRAAAYFIDLLVLYGVMVFGIQILALMIAELERNAGDRSGNLAAILMTAGFFLVYESYFMILEWFMNGQTPGKRLLGIRVIKRGGYALGFLDSVIRNLLRVIDFIPLFYGVGLVSLLLTRSCQRIGDMAAGTFVVYQEEVKTSSLLVQPPRTRATFDPLPPALLAAVPVEAVTLADEYLTSREQLLPRPRQEIAAALVTLITRASGLAYNPRQSVEGFLEAVVTQSSQIPPSTSQSPQEFGFPS